LLALLAGLKQEILRLKVYLHGMAKSLFQA